MNNYSAGLDFNFKPLRDEFNFDDLKNRKHSKINLEDVNPKFISLLDSIGLKVHLAECFYRAPFSKSQIHRDVQGTESATKLNWVFGGSGSSMNWYAHSTDTIRTSITDIGVVYQYYELEDVTMLHSEQIQSPSLLEVALPHNITMGHEDRICISIVLKYKDKNSFPTYTESISLFKDYVSDLK